MFPPSRLSPLLNEFQTTPNIQRSSENLFCNDRVESDVGLCGRALRETNIGKIKRYKDEEGIFDVVGNAG